MNHTIYMAYAGLRSRAEALEVLTNNIANISSVGFKRQRVYFNVRDRASGEDFSQMAEAINRPVVEARTHTDFTVGEMRQTGNPLSLALMGEGFFVVETPEGLRYTRNGSFRVSQKENLVTVDGHRIVAEGWTPEKPKYITLPGGAVEIAPNGQVSVDGVILAKLKLVSFQDLSQLKRIGASLFEAPADLQETVPPTTTAVAQGYLEQANLSPIETLSDVINVMRSFEMLARTIRSLTKEVDQKVINEVGRI